MAKWDYGEEGQAFPVAVGEVWAVGDHVFVCSDLMATEVFDGVLTERLGAVSPAILYCDPPWGQSLVNSFRTKAGLERASYRWEDLYRRIADIGHQRDWPVWIEGSKHNSRDGSKIPDAIYHRGAGRAFDRHWDVTYYHKASNVSGLYYAGARPVPLSLGLADPLTGRDDDDTPGIVMQAYGPAGIVVDPCAGRGQTSREAQRNGWVSLNNELNPFRVSAALVRMSKLIEEAPRRVA